MVGVFNLLVALGDFLNLLVELGAGRAHAGQLALFRNHAVENPHGSGFVALDELEVAALLVFEFLAGDANFAQLGLDADVAFVQTGQAFDNDGPAAGDTLQALLGLHVARHVLLQRAAELLFLVPLDVEGGRSFGALQAQLLPTFDELFGFLIERLEAGRGRIEHGLARLTLLVQGAFAFV